MLLTLNSISKSYGSPENQNRREVLKAVSLELQESESIAILGPSGSGKSTLLNIIGSLDNPDTGEVYFRDMELTSLSEKRREQYRNKDIGFIFQLHHLLPQCTLIENVLIPTLNLVDKEKKEERFEYALSLMKRVGVYEQRHQKPAQLSGGECQRAAVIRAMINSPSLLLADEPTGALDADNAEKLSELLLELNKTEKVALIVVTHSMELARRMGKVFVLENGELVL